MSFKTALPLFTLLLFATLLIAEQKNYIPKDSSLVGRWEGEGYYKNQKGPKTLIFNKDGTYMDIVTVLSSRKDTLYGTWDQNGNQLTTLCEGSVEMHRFMVNGKKLTIDGYKTPVTLQKRD